MPDDPRLIVSQAIFLAESGGPRVVGKSAEFLFDWEEAAKRILVLLGAKPDGIAVSAELFARPVSTTHVAVVQLAEHASGDLAFRFLLFGRALYEALGDPFAIAECFPTDWSARGDLPTLAWPTGPLPKRTVAGLQERMKTGDGPLLLGSTQALLDGRRVCLPYGESTGETVKTIWQLLPDRTRCELWPATLAFSADLGFHLWAMPEVPVPMPPDTLSVEQAKDYPEGRYELALQSAIESGDQAEMDRLFARRTSSEVLRTAAILVGGVLLIALGFKLVAIL